MLTFIPISYLWIYQFLTTSSSNLINNSICLSSSFYHWLHLANFSFIIPWFVFVVGCVLCAMKRRWLLTLTTPDLSPSMQREWTFYIHTTFATTMNGEMQFWICKNIWWIKTMNDLYQIIKIINQHQWQQLYFISIHYCH